MFALEINFQDGVSQPEMILVRRPQALVGASDYAHVLVEDMRPLQFQLRLIREIGNRFQVRLVAADAETDIPSGIEGMYEGAATVSLGPVRLVITALDTDLALKDGEPPDRAGVRIVRKTALEPSPSLPAIVVAGVSPIVVSFSPDQPVYIGRSKQCAVRLDSADISARHARIGYEQGEFWVEDLGSTNGTFVSGQQIAGRLPIASGAAVVLGREITIVPVASEEEIARAIGYLPAIAQPTPKLDARYPILISVSEVARPARVVLNAGSAVTIGRDPTSEMWLGAPHVSRKHCLVILSPRGMISVTDHSTNGTAFDSGLLHKGDVLELKDEPHVFDFGNGVTVALCFDQDQENAFVASQGAVAVFQHSRSLGRGADQRPQGRVAAPSAVEELQVERRLGLLARVVYTFQSLPLGGKILISVAALCLVGLLVMVAVLLAGIFLK